MLIRNDKSYENTRIMMKIATWNVRGGAILPWYENKKNQ